MKKFLLALLFLASTFGCSSHRPPTVLVEPTPATLTTASTVAKSTVSLVVSSDYHSYSCTAFSIAPRIFLTAAHCTAPMKSYSHPIIRINGVLAFVLTEDVERDISVIISDLNLPALAFRQEVLRVGEPVHAIGYSYGFSVPIVTYHVVELINYIILPDIYKGTIFLYPFAGGMSGGPIYDVNGLVVGLIQRSTTEVGYGVSAETIIKFLEE